MVPGWSIGSHPKAPGDISRLGTHRILPVDERLRADSDGTPRLVISLVQGPPFLGRASAVRSSQISCIAWSFCSRDIDSRSSFIRVTVSEATPRATPFSATARWKLSPPILEMMRDAAPTFGSRTTEEVA